MTFPPIRQDVSVCTAGVDTEGKGSATLAFGTDTRKQEATAGLTSGCQKTSRPDRTK